MPQLEIDLNKTLKLTNVLIYKSKCLDLTDTQDLDKQVTKMQNYIKVKGAKQIGPLIQYSELKADETGNMNMEVMVLLQSSLFISNAEFPYIMEESICIPNCIYCRYNGPSERMNFAYDKITLTAFEKDIPLKGGVYTVFLELDELEENAFVDVFMERAD